jgi:signal transduction histidine kinase
MHRRTDRRRPAQGPDRHPVAQQIVELCTRQQASIGREIHDGLGQELTAALMFTRGLEQRLRTPGAQLAPDDLRHLGDRLAAALETARRLSRGLAPADLDGADLPVALVDLAARIDEAGPARCTCGIIGVGDATGSERLRRLGPEGAAHLFRIAQEALSNALRHADASRMSVCLEVTDDLIRLEVCDDGKGLPVPAEGRGHLGLRLMRYRARILGGRYSIGPQRHGGTRLCCEVPLPPARTPATR